MADDRNSEAKLLEISREAHKLTQIINSWPKTPNFDGQARDMTEDLMRGALDLQQSLITLKSLRGASSKVKSHDKNASERESGVGEVSFGLTGPGRFERLAMDGTLFHYIEDLKRVIRDETCSQNPATVSKDDNTVFSRRKSLGFLMSADLNLPPKKSKGPSLIAKLMGLEECPPEAAYPTRKGEENEDNVVQPRSIPAIKMLETRKNQLMAQNPELRTKKVKDIVEVVKSKETSVSDEIKKHNRMQCSAPRFDHEVPANMTRQRTPQLPRYRLQFDKVPASKDTRAASKLPEETVCDNQEITSRRYELREFKNVKRNKAVTYQKTAGLAPVNREEKRRVPLSTSEKGNQKPRPLMNGRKAGERKESEAIITAPKSQPRLKSRAPAKSDNGSIIKKVVSSNGLLVISKGSNTSRNHNLTSSLKPRSQVSNDSVKVKKNTEVKPVRKSTDIKAVTGKAMCKDVREKNQVCNLPVDAPLEKKAQKSNPYLRECNSKESKLLCEVMVKSSKGRRSYNTPEETIQFQDNRTVIQATGKVKEAEVQLLFLSSQSFIRHAQELFKLNGYQAMHHQRQCSLELATRKIELLLDCAKELMIRKRNQLELSSHKLLQPSVMCLAVESLDQLAYEISAGIENLTDYCKDAAAGVSLRDGVYVRLERDLRCKDMMLNAMWDIGWVNWDCVEEVNDVVGQVEELILHGLVEELVFEIVYEWNDVNIVCK